MRRSTPASDSDPNTASGVGAWSLRGRLRRLVAGAVLGIVLFAALPPTIYAFRRPAVIEFGADPPRRIVSGVYPAEVAPDGRTFAWSRETFSIALPGLDRRVPWRLTLHIAASRPDGSAPSLLTAVDGTAVSTTTLPAGGFVDHVVAVEPRPDRPRSTTVSFRVMPPFVPDGDPRELGAQIDRIQIAPAGGWPRLTLDWRAPLAWGAVMGTLAAVATLPASVVMAWLALTALLVAQVVTAGIAPYAGAAWWAALGAGAGAAIAAAAVLPRARPGASAAVLITFTAAALQLLVLLHPDMPLGDALFHAHRFQDVRAGKYFFTSVAPGGYQFPYPIGLYVIAGPLAQFTRSALENATMLRIVVVIANAIAASLLYRVANRWRADDVAAASAVAAFHLIPLSFGVIATGNLTNVFSQALALISLALAAEIAAGDGMPRRRILWWSLLALFAAAAMLSHTSTFAMLTAQLGLAGLWLAIRGAGGNTTASRTGLAIAGAVAVAAAVAVAVYYSRFGDVYREAWGRIAAETGRATGAAGGRTPYTRLAEAPQWLLAYYGVPILALGGLGLAFARRGRRSLQREVSVLIGGWLAVAAFFMAIGIVTPVDLRHFYAAAPAAAILSGLALSQMWDRSAWSAAAAVLAGGWALAVGWQATLDWLTRGG